MLQLIGTLGWDDKLVNALANATPEAWICSSSTTEVLLLILTGYYPVMAASVAAFKTEDQVPLIVPESEAALPRQTLSARIIPYKPAVT